MIAVVIEVGDAVDLRLGQAIGEYVGGAGTGKPGGGGIDGRIGFIGRSEEQLVFPNGAREETAVVLLADGLFDLGGLGLRSHEAVVQIVGEYNTVELIAAGAQRQI